MTELPCVLILGATGLFGGLLARRLVNENHFSVIGAARGKEALLHLNKSSGAQTVVVDRDNETAVNEVLNSFAPFAVVDCAGPFQYYGADPYRFARQVLRAGCHYIDIADACDFVVGIVELDELAKEQSRSAISGASSTPAISSAVVDKLTKSLMQIVSIETTIIPGNRARRTYSVMKSILGQVGKPFDITRYGKNERVFGWSSTRRINLTLPVANPVVNRLASLVHTPDDALFPQRYNAQTVTLRAGLEIKLFHRVLELSALLVRMRLLHSIAPLTPVARWIASLFENAGSDVGGMQVIVVGKDSDQRIVRRTWDMVASDGHGPEIPTLPVSVLLHKLNSSLIEAGARPSPGDITLNDLKPQFNQLDIKTCTHEEFVQPLFKAALGESFNLLPLPVQKLHSTIGQTVYRGRTESKGPTGLTGRLAAWLFRFPGAARDVPIQVTVTADESRETWVREFAGTSFKSHLSLDAAGYAQERFGPITARLNLQVLQNRLLFPVSGAKLFSLIPLPRVLLPVSVAHESADEHGRFVFDVNVTSPFGARIAHYRGWLLPE